MRAIEQAKAYVLVEAQQDTATYYYVADRETSSPLSDGYLDHAEAKLALSLFEKNIFPEEECGDLILNARGEVIDGDSAGWVQFLTDWENNGEEFWDFALGVIDEDWLRLIERDGLWLPQTSARNFLETVKTFPGWDSPPPILAFGPEGWQNQPTGV